MSAYSKSRDWKKIDDDSILKLIKEILDNLANDSIIQNNSEMLERKYGKPEGFVCNLIFHMDIDNENLILEELKKDKIIYL